MNNSLVDQLNKILKGELLKTNCSWVNQLEKTQILNLTNQNESLIDGPIKYKIFKLIW